MQARPQFQGSLIVFRTVQIAKAVALGIELADFLGINPPGPNRVVHGNRSQLATRKLGLQPGKQAASVDGVQGLQVRDSSDRSLIGNPVVDQGHR